MPSANETDVGIEEKFRENVRIQPYAEAIVEGDRTINYQELDILATKLSIQLSKYNLSVEEPIGILLPGGIANIAAQIAILRVGGTCVPLDVALPDQRIQALYDSLNVRIVFISVAEGCRFTSFEKIIPENSYELCYNADVSKLRIVSTNGRHRTHIFHTSGTTGKPKPVEIESRGITRIAHNTHVTQMRRTDRVAQLAAPSFDAVLHEVWATLICGGTVVVFSKKIVVDPWALYEGFVTHRVSSAMVTATLFSHLVAAIPYAFASLDVVFTVGEAANLQALQMVLEKGPPKKLINGYGPTECSTVASFHEITIEDCKRGIVPIGKAIDETEIYILDEHRVPVEGDRVVEIHIGGTAVSRGYYQCPEANAKSFIEVENLSDSGAPKRLYRTGDLARYLEGGAIDFVGRADNLIKIRGYSVDILEIESVISKSGLARSFVVTPVVRAEKEKYLVAFITPKASFSAFSGQLDAYFKQFLPSYMVPRIEIVGSFPMTLHGKVDRRALVDTHIRAVEQAETDLGQLFKTENESILLWLQCLWTSVLDVSNVNFESNFFELGGSSLQAAAILVHIRQRYDLKISIQQIYSNPVLKGLAKLIEVWVAPTEVDISKLQTFLDDSCLVKDLEVLPGEVPNWQDVNEGRIFVTGTTGFLGVHFLRDLIDRSEVKEVRCLVRAATSRAAHTRLLSMLRHFSLDQTKNLYKINAVPGDLAEDLFGFSALDFSKLASWASVIFHCGARVNYLESYEAHRPSNVTGTLNCIKLAMTSHPKVLHYVSSAAVAGPVSYFKSTTCVRENANLSEFTDSLVYDLGYTQSKWVAENLVQSMLAKGLRAVIYRPGFILGDCFRGTVNRSDFMSSFFLGCMKLGFRPILPGHSKLMISANFASAAMIHISKDPNNYNKTFHLTPQPENDIDMEATFRLLESIGYHFNAMPYRQWVELLARDRDMLKNPLLSFLPILQEPVHNGLTLMELYEDMAVLDTSECRKALADMKPDVKSCVDLAFLQNYMEALTRNL